MNQIRSIVVGVDFTEGCRSALAQGVRFAAATGARLRVGHFIEPLVVHDLSEALDEPAAAMSERLIDDARAAWGEFAAERAGAVELEVRVAHPVAGMMGLVREAGADMLVLGMRGASGAEQGAGSVATACVRKGRTKTLLVRPGRTGEFGVIVAGVDFSPTSREAVGQAARIAATDKAQLHIVHAFDPPWQRLHYRAPTTQTSPDFRKQFTDGLARRLRAFCAEEIGEARAGMTEYHLLEGRGHGAVMVRSAHELRADLVVVGTRGRTNLRDMLLGSTAERVLRDSPCSILTIDARE